MDKKHEERKVLHPTLNLLAINWNDDVQNPRIQAIPTLIMDKHTLVSICTVLNDSSTIVESYLHDVTKELEQNYKYYEVVLVDNGSKDGTVLLVKELLKRFHNVRLQVLSREYEQQIAYTAAIENCIGDYIVIMDINNDPPAAIPRLVTMAIEGADIVTAALPQSHSAPKRLLSRLFYRFNNILTDNRIELSWTNYICFSRRMANAIIAIKDRVRYLKYFHSNIGYKHVSIEVLPLDPPRKVKNVPILDELFFAMDNLVSNSVKLIRIATLASLMMSMLSFMYILYAIAIRLFKSNVAEGWTSTSIFFSFLFGLLFFVLFIVGEYLSLIYRESRKGPLYHIAEEASSSVLFNTITDKNVITPEA